MGSSIDDIWAVRPWDDAKQEFGVTAHYRAASGIWTRVEAPQLEEADPTGIASASAGGGAVWIAALARGTNDVLLFRLSADGSIDDHRADLGINGLVTTPTPFQFVTCPGAVFLSVGSVAPFWTRLFRLEGDQFVEMPIPTSSWLGVIESCGSPSTLWAREYEGWRWDGKKWTNSGPPPGPWKIAVASDGTAYALGSVETGVRPRRFDDATSTWVELPGYSAVTSEQWPHLVTIGDTPVRISHLGIHEPYEEETGETSVHFSFCAAVAEAHLDGEVRMRTLVDGPTRLQAVTTFPDGSGVANVGLQLLYLGRASDFLPRP